MGVSCFTKKTYQCFTLMADYAGLGCTLEDTMLLLDWREAHDTGVAWCRDFFIFTAWRHQRDLLRPEGIIGKHVEWRSDEKLFRAWIGGRTGLPFVDACMRELACTGYLSNRGRQNVASLFCKVCDRSCTDVLC